MKVLVLSQFVVIKTVKKGQGIDIIIIKGNVFKMIKIIIKGDESRFSEALQIYLKIITLEQWILSIEFGRVLTKSISYLFKR